MAAGLPLLLCFVRLRPTVVHVAGAVLLAYAGLSVLWAPVPVEALQGLVLLTILGLAFCLGAEAGDLTQFYRAIALGLCVNAPIALLQAFGVSWIDRVVEQVMPPAGLFANKNMLGEAAALALAGCLAGRLPWPFWIGPAICLGLAQCWGGFAGVTVAVLVAVAQRSRLAAVVMALGIVLAAHTVLLVKPDRAHTVVVRGWIAMDAIENLRWFGHGVGQYWVTTPERAPRQESLNTRHWHAHNDGLEMVYEFGLGAVFYFLMLGLCLAAPSPRERIVLCAFLAVGLFGFPLYTATTALVGAVVAGSLAGAWPRLRLSVARRADHRGAGHAGARPLRGAHWRAVGRRAVVSARSVLARAAGTRGGGVASSDPAAGGAADHRRDAAQRSVRLGPAP